MSYNLRDSKWDKHPDDDEQHPHFLSQLVRGRRCLIMRYGLQHRGNVEEASTLAMEGQGSNGEEVDTRRTETRMARPVHSAFAPK